MVEEASEVFANRFTRGEKPEVFIEARGLWVVVSGADVAVAAQCAALLANDQGQLAVGLQAHDAVNHVNSGLLELSGPGDVGLLVEARLDLDQSQNLLARLSCVDQRVDNRAVTAGSVKGLLDS